SIIQPKESVALSVSRHKTPHCWSCSLRESNKDYHLLSIGSRQLKIAQSLISMAEATHWLWLKTHADFLKESGLHGPIDPKEYLLWSSTPLACI
ncbi:MAG: hypothetical protein ACK5VW_05175, partial [Holosporales bacterium]